MERQAEEAAVPEVVHVGAEVGEDRRRRVAEAVEDLDQPALLGDEDAPVGREAHVRRVVQAGDATDS